MIPISKPIITKEAKDFVMRVLDSGNLAQGHVVSEFESNFARYCNSNHAVATNSGTSALHCALYALGIGKGDEVITTPFTFIASASCMLMQGAVPVFSDIEEETFNLDPQKIEEKITKKTKAILPVDLYGHPYDHLAINKIARKHGLFVIEDACQAIGAEIDGKRAGSLADISAFSFYATKNLTTGEGGMVVTDNEEFSDRCRLFRHHGQPQDKRYEYTDWGYNYRMTDIAAAIGVAQLKDIDPLNKKRMENAKFLTEQLSGIPQIITPVSKKTVRHVYHQYTIKTPASKRDAVISYLRESGIGCGIYYPKPLHLFQLFSKLGYKKGDFPVSEEASNRVISLPVHPYLSHGDLTKITEALKSVKWND